MGVCVCGRKSGGAGIATSYVHRYLCVRVDKGHNHVDNELICNIMYAKHLNQQDYLQ